MKKIIMILSAILTLLGCKSEEKKFLENHKVIFYKSEEYQNFEKQVKINIKIAYKIAFNYAIENNLEPMCRMFFVIDNHYVFTSYFNEKIPNASISGIWVNATTGEPKLVKGDLRLIAYYSFKE